MFTSKFICSLTLLLITVPVFAASLEQSLASHLAKMPADETVEVIVKLKEEPAKAGFKATSAGESRQKRLERVVTDLKEKSDRSRFRMKAIFERETQTGSIRNIRPFWIFNGFLITATPEGIRQLAEDPEIASITPNTVLKQAVAVTTAATVDSWNLNMVHAPELWSKGFSGQGAVVASFDSGVDVSHTALTAKWRGGSNSWYDPYRSTTAPYDLSGHGTATTGLMIGGNTGDNKIGVAPGAEWIAAKIFDDNGNATLATIHAAFQWALDPDGDLATDDAPDVVNNSWDLSNTTGLYDAEFQADIDTLRTVGIAVVFAAGNQGPLANSSTSPGNNPGAFPVGSVDSSGSIEIQSSRGPSAADGSAYPLLAAPGVNVRSTDLYNSYRGFSGTSFAAPHAAGAIALLRSALPALPLTEIEEALKNSVVGASGADNSYGYGRLDVLKAYSYLALPGDVNGNGTVDMADVLLLLNAVVSEQTTALISRNGSVSPLDTDDRPNRSGGIPGISDVLLVLQKALGVINW